MRPVIARFLNPRKFRREQDSRRLALLRQRDGDSCARCRRPIRFDLPPGHDLGAKVEQIRGGSAGGSDELAHFCLVHGRCNANAGDATEQVMERLRPRREAELFGKSRRKRRA